MTDQQTVRLTPNGKGAQPYLSKELLNDSASVLRRGQECRAQLVEGVGILITPATDTREFTVSTMSTPGGED